MNDDTFCGLNGSIIILLPHSGLCCSTELYGLCFFCYSLTLHIILGDENSACGMFLSKGFFSFHYSTIEQEQAYGALRVLHHPAPGWSCVTATTNTNRNPETNSNMHLPCLTSHLTYPRPSTYLLASGCCQQCREVHKKLS